MEAAYLEKNLMETLDSPYILKSICCFEDNNYFCLVTDLMHGDVRTYLNCLDTLLDEVRVKKYFRQMVLAVDHCHQKSIMHRDVKLENFLFMLNMDDKTTIERVILADFGMACIFDQDTPPCRPCGTHVTMAPEVIKETFSYDLKADCWSLGIILHELLSTELPFDSENPDEIKKEIINKEIRFDK